MQDANLVLDELVRSALEKVAIENPTVVQRGRVVQGSPTLLVFCLNIIFYTQKAKRMNQRDTFVVSGNFSEMSLTNLGW